MKTPSKVVTRLALSLPIILGVTASATAHDFWLDAPTFVVGAGDTVHLATRMGHADSAQAWPLSASRVVALRSVGPNGISDHQASVEGIDDQGRVPLTLQGEGVHVVSLESTEAFSELPAEKFNAYLREEGLQPLLDARARSGRNAAPGREMYSRRGKALIVVGDSPDALPEHALRPVGLTLEIMLDALPSQLSPGEPMCAVVLYRGQPTKGIRLALNGLDGEQPGSAFKITDASGQACFERPEPGRYFLHSVWSSPAPTRQAEYSTVFSSLSFSIE